MKRIFQVTVGSIFLMAMMYVIPQVTVGSLHEFAFSSVEASDASQIVLRARGVKGGEVIELRNGDQLLTSWTLATGIHNYVYTPSDQITVSTLSLHYVNETTAANAALLYYLQVDDVKYQSKSSKTVWQGTEQCSQTRKKGVKLECDGSLSYAVPSGLLIGEGFAICGNGLVEASEQCDDGNVLSGDGCDASCSIEVVPTVCGNGAVEAGEQCDDGNLIDGDGCAASCQAEVVPAICGNEQLESGEQCDDGNLLGGDGCSAACVLEVDATAPSVPDIIVRARGRVGGEVFELRVNGITQASWVSTTSLTNYTYTPDTPLTLEDVAVHYVGDVSSSDSLGLLAYYVEVDGVRYQSRVASWSAASDCAQSNKKSVRMDCNGSFVYTRIPQDIIVGTPQDPDPICGDGLLDVGESCDDGNVLAGDGCSALCSIEAPLCGNTLLESGESCDDGNLVGGDGCSATCSIEVPQPVCGNAAVEMNEQCDDGNLIGGDGCSAVCSIEVPICGNGVVEFEETCDDGNVSGNDGCSAVCSVEQPTGTDLSNVRIGFWGEQRNRITPTADGVLPFFENSTFSHTKAYADPTRADYVISVIDDARATGTSLDIQLGGSEGYGWDFSQNKGPFDYDLWIAQADTFFAASSPEISQKIAEAINDGTIRYVFILDEPHHRRWAPSYVPAVFDDFSGELVTPASGSDYNHITNAQLDAMAAHLKTEWPNVQTIVRAAPERLLAYDRGSYTFEHLTHAYLTFSSTKSFNKSLESFIEDNVSLYDQTNLDIAVMLQAGFESRFHPYDGQEQEGFSWWTGGLNLNDGYGDYVKAAPFELDYWVKSILRNRNAATGALDQYGERIVDDIVIFRADRNGETVWQRQHYADFYTEIQSDIANNDLTPENGLIIGG